VKSCCPCDDFESPGKPEIAAGLPALPRQLAGFVEYRLAMLRDIPLHPALSQWRARAGADLGIMLLEMWAYALDILAFYDERIANETYLRTAVLRPSLRKLVELIGYQPRPALAASVVLGAIADGNRIVKLPPGTGFRSDAFDGEPPQVFETEVEHTIHRLKNQWTLGPVREETVSDRLLLEAGTARVTRDQIVVFVWPVFQTGGTPGVARGFRLGERPSLKPEAGKVVAAKKVEARDGQSYVELTVEPALRINPKVRLADVQTLSPTLSAALTAVIAGRASFQTSAQFGQAIDPTRKAAQLAGAAFRTSTQSGVVQSGVGITNGSQNSGQSSIIQLDAVYRQIQQGDRILISSGSDFRLFEVEAARETDVTVSGQVTVQVTELTLSPALPSEWQSQSALRSLTVHFNLAPVGRLTRVAKTELSSDDFALPGLPIEGLVEPIPESIHKPSSLLLRDAVDNGVFAGGTVDINESGEGRVSLAANTPPFTPGLRTPVTVYGNPVRATRGESVFDEVLGSGDASQSFQSFALGNKPLTYINDLAAPNGRRSALEVRVNAIKWREAPSFFGVGPDDEVYIVRQNDEGESVVTFGDGITGARLPTGVDNITATYRFGAGAAKPPAGAISQLARPVEGLRRVVNPVAAGGGADADQPKDIRKNAPNSALILGRAVSTADFEALAREFGGVINAHVEWAWDESRQRAVVMVWFISDGGDIAKELRAFLIGQADPNTPLVAVQAQARPSQLVIDLEIDPRFKREIVGRQVRDALTNPDTGILALQNIQIGRPLFRSRIFDIALSVEGARSIRAMTVDGQPAPFAITVEQGRYRNFLNGLVV
jgi:predicted phage baseplate assembly protein